jgi:hypothetical protein
MRSVMEPRQSQQRQVDEIPVTGRQAGSQDDQ